MSSYVGAGGEYGPSKDGERGAEGAGGEGREADAQHSRVERPWRRNLAGEGRSGLVEQLVRPALPGRKAHRKTCRWTQDRDEERGRQRPVKTVGDGDGGGTESSSGSDFDNQSNSAADAAGGSTDLHRGHRCPRPHGAVCPGSTNLNPQSPQPAVRSKSLALPQPPVQTRPTALSPRRRSSRTSAADLQSHTPGSPREPDPFWVEVRTAAGIGFSSQIHRTLSHLPPLTGSEPRAAGAEEEDEEEEEGRQQRQDSEEGGSGAAEVTSQASAPALPPPPPLPPGERRMSKRERNRMKCLRRRQRRKERWRQSQLQESRQSSTANPSSSSSSSGDDSGDSEEEVSVGDKDGYICAVCLDVYFSPYMCHPCNHVFCEPCLRTLAKNSPTNTPCPLCRTVITHVFFQKELNQTARTFFPKEYLSRKQNFQKASCAKWPLPSCRKLFRIFGGFQRQSSPMARRQFPHGGGYRLDAMDFEDDSRGWRFDMDMVIIYIYSVNWVIGFFVFCFLCYLFFPSF